MTDDFEYPHILEWLQANNMISGDFVSNHCISWIDILGYKNKMKSSVADLNEYLTRINYAISDSLKMLEYKNGNRLEFRIFSDNILIFVKMHSTPSDIFDTYNVMLCSTYIQAILTCKFGIQVRGCICKGLFYNNEKFVFGPAIAKAYETESTKVKMPRVLVDDSIVQTLSDYKEFINSAIQEEFKKILIEEDSELYINYYSVYDYKKAKTDLPHIVSSMELIILEHLVKPDFNAIDKINYTLSKFNEFSKKFNFECEFPKLNKPSTNDNVSNGA